MADTQGFLFDIGIGVLSEVDPKKNPDVFNECVQLRRAIRLVASYLGSNSGSVSTELTDAIARIVTLENNPGMKITRKLEATVTILNGNTSANYVITPAVADVNKTFIIPLGHENTTVGAALTNVSNRLRLIDVSTIQATRTSSGGDLVIEFQLFEFT